MKLAKDITGEDLEALGFVQKPPVRYLYSKGSVSVGLLHMQIDGQERLCVYTDQWTVEFTGTAPAPLVMAAILQGEAS